MPTIKQISKWQRGSAPVTASDELADEEPLEVRVNSRGVSITMRTPGHDDELAAGFLLSEGMIRGRADIVGITPNAQGTAGNSINVVLAPRVVLDFDRLTRHVFASSSCGLCGKTSIESVHQQFAPIDSHVRVDANMILALPDRLRAVQQTFDRTGGLHAAAIFSAEGNLIVAREDVGRHNAVDKVLGHCLLNDRLPLDQHILMVSGRASFEIMQKALAGRVAIVAAVSAPSSLAVDFATDSHQTLIGFLRGERMNIYAGAERIQFGS